MQYAKAFTDALQFMWGKGFLSPGGPEEVRQMLAGQDLTGKIVLDVGAGLGGIDVLLAREHGAAEVVGIDVEPQLIEAARALAERMMREGGSTPEERLLTGYRLATSRTPDSQTLLLLRDGFGSRLAGFQADPESATKLISHGASLPDPSLDRTELAAYTVTASILLNLDRVVTRD